MASGRTFQISVEQVGLASVLDHYWLEVPLNQREYSWTQNEVQTLFQDLSKAIAEDSDGYFLGSLVTVNVPDRPDRLVVVDGQQRLATTAILVAAIREYLLAQGETLLAQVATNLISKIDPSERCHVPKLKLNVDDNEFFVNRILDLDKDEGGPDATQPSLPSHDLLLEAKQLAKAHVAQIVATLKPSEHGRVLTQWIQYLQYNASVLLLKSPDQSSAFRMFETLNDRGIKVSQADLIKNFLFGEAQDRIQEAQSHWSQMRGTLEVLDEKDITLTYLRQAMISYTGYVRADRLFEEVERAVRGRNSAMTLVARLDNSSSDYVAILSPDNDKWNSYPPDVRRAIRTLSLLGVKPMRPLMLAVARGFSKKQAAIAYRRMVSWGARFLIAGGTRSGAVEIPLADAAQRVSSGEIKTADELSDRVDPLVPNDVQFREAFEVANVSKSALARYYLRALEGVARSETDPWFVLNENQDQINLEHVLPKKTEDNWPQFDAQEHKSGCRKLGNQVLLQASSNSDLKSAGFDKKREVYQSAPYSLTSQVGDLHEWTTETIHQRQKILAGLALKAWPLR